MHLVGIINQLMKSSNITKSMSCSLIEHSIILLSLTRIILLQINYGINTFFKLIIRKGKIFKKQTFRIDFY